MELNDPDQAERTSRGEMGGRAGRYRCGVQARHLDGVNKGTMHRAGFSAKTRINRHDFSMS